MVVCAWITGWSVGRYQCRSAAGRQTAQGGLAQRAGRQVGASAGWEWRSRHAVGMRCGWLHPGQVSASRRLWIRQAKLSSTAMPVAIDPQFLRDITDRSVIRGLGSSRLASGHGIAGARVKGAPRIEVERRGCNPVRTRLCRVTDGAQLRRCQLGNPSPGALLLVGGG